MSNARLFHKDRITDHDEGCQRHDEPLVIGTQLINGMHQQTHRSFSFSRPRDIIDIGMNQMMRLSGNWEAKAAKHPLSRLKRDRMAARQSRRAGSPPEIGDDSG